MIPFIYYLAEKVNNDLIAYVIDKLKQENYDFTRTTQTGSIIKIFTDRPRIEVVNELLGIFNDSYISPKKETIVLIKNTSIQLVVKPKGKQGIKSAGLENEQALISGINRLCQENQIHNGINIRFIGMNGVTFECKNVTGAIGVGQITKGRKKADLIIKGNIDYPISLKKRNAEYWESADSYIYDSARTVINTALKNNEIELLPVPGVEGAVKLNRELAFKATPEQTRDVVFGSDILGKGCVIQETFTNIKYTISEDNYIEIPVAAIFKTVKDVINDNEHNVWFLIRNDKTRSSKKLGLKGIRILAVYHKRVRQKSKIK